MRKHLRAIAIGNERLARFGEHSLPAEHLFEYKGIGSYAVVSTELNEEVISCSAVRTKISEAVETSKITDKAEHIKTYA